MHQYNLTRNQLNLVSAATHKAAVSNPFAQFRREISPEIISKSAPIADPLRLLDCSPISDGAAAIILSTSKKAPVHIAASQLANDHLSLTDRDSITSFLSTKTAMDRALEESNWEAKDIDVLELHDCFSIASLIHLEDMGFSDAGEAIEWWEQKQTGADGKLPINVSGGLKACGHPIGATGVKQVLDVWKQLTGNASSQVKNCRRGLAHNLGGVGATCTIHLLKREPS